MKNNFTFLFLNRYFLLFLSACATTGPTGDLGPCHSADWNSLGFADGEKGEFQDHLQQHQRTCEASGGSANRDQYLSGWERGHKTYCTAENGYKAGVSGRYSSDICTDSADYVQQFKIGQAARQPAIQAP